MRVRALVCLAMGLAFAAVIGISRADPDKDATRIAGLIRQLGSPEFAKREAAGKELEAIGEPALEALRKAANDNDPEVRKRAEQVLVILNERFRVAIAKKELAKWQGNWFGNADETMTIKGDKWTAGTPTYGPNTGTLQRIDVRETMTHVDLVVENGPNKGLTCKAILRVDVGTLHYCGTYNAIRPTEFKSDGANVHIAFHRVKPIPPPPPPPVIVEETFESAELPTELALAESKAGIRRVNVRARLTDGGKVTLNFNPNTAKLNEFGDPLAPAKQLPIMTLDCTLKLVKQEKERTLYEIRGAKLASKLSFVAFKDVTPWGDGRLLVHRSDGAVRYSIDLHIPRQNFPPCHPGCFPAGTAVRVPGGTKSIELVREGDLVVTTDANGKPSMAKVTGLFTTRNRVLEVRVEGAKLVTTETQPIAIEAGGYRPAGEIKAGDRIWRWTGGKRQAVAVQSVTAADRETSVFNLVLGEPTVFIAGDFLVRSKPPPAQVKP